MARAQLSLVLRQIRKLAGDRTATDRQLLHQFATEQEGAAFELLVERHGPAVLDLCRRILRHEHDAEDVFQATFLALARKASSIRKPESLGCWLYGVASRLAFKVRASRKRAIIIRQTVTPRTGEEICAALDEELNRLPGRYQAPIILCYLEGKTREEAARQPGWSLGTLKLRLSQGREILRQRLMRRGLTLTAVLTAVGLSRKTVPAALVISTARTALQFVTGSAVGVAAQLAEGVLQGMVLERLTYAATLLLAVGFAGAGAGLIANHAWTANQPERRQPASGGARTQKPLAPAEARTDRYGDPLPPGALARWGTRRFQHPFLDGLGIRSVAFSPDGKILATGSWDHTIRLWNRASGQELRRLCGLRTSLPGSPFRRTVRRWYLPVEAAWSAFGSKRRVRNSARLQHTRGAGSPEYPSLPMARSWPRLA
jgi:RNA polymerase sigma factor (sigma-70 family)